MPKVYSFTYLIWCVFSVLNLKDFNGPIFTGDWIVIISVFLDNSCMLPHLIFAKLWQAREQYFPNIIYKISKDGVWLQHVGLISDWVDLGLVIHLPKVAVSSCETKEEKKDIIFSYAHARSKWDKKPVKHFDPTWPNENISYILLLSINYLTR